MEIRINRKLAWVALALLAFGVLMRLLPHPANLAPVGAIALFGGAVLPRRLAWWLPVAIMVVSDLFIGTYHGIVFTWAGFLLVGLYGMSLRRMHGLPRVVIGVAGSSVIFFLVSNFGVWAQGQLYAHTWTGLAQCYTLALPFFRNTFIGDALYAGLLFGLYAFAQSRVAARMAEPSAD
ncbi:MAG TPA: DUF6580 family putative transport protein [Candidatus Saccharimonadales bacterium]